MHPWHSWHTCIPWLSCLLRSAVLLLVGAPAWAGDSWEPFKAVTRPAVPTVDEVEWVLNPIDAFVAEQREKRLLPHRPPAPKHILLRRVYLDLTGLQPTPDELHDFLADSAPDAYERVVDRLLNSAQYGERWGRHWMDIWRYSDWAGWTGGNQIRDSQPHIWRWRDWIIESLNADKPYDRMILEMLAADEISPTDQDALRATGYLVRNYKMLSRETWLQDTVKHTAQAFLGVTLDCARCHEHKYDPFPQEDYYRFRAFFEPHQVRTDRLPGQSDTTKDGIVRAYDADPAVPTYLFIRGDDRTPAKDKPIPPGVPVALAGPPLHVQSVALPLTAYAPDKVDYVIRETLEASARAAEQAKASLENNRKKMVETEIALAELAAECAEAQRAALEATIRVEQFEDSGGREREPTNFAALAVDATARQRWAALMEGKKNQLVAARNIQAAQRASTKAQESSAAAPTDKKLQEAAQKAAADLEKAQQKLTETESELLKAKQNSLVPPTVDYTKRATKSYPQSSTGRRSALARWIADCSNPLTTRVAINHIWNRHFGAPIVPSVFDFGAGGRKPTHPALLDWLAAELVQPTFSTGATHPPKSWSMKHIHRLIVTSATFRMASTSDGAALAADPDNRYLWRMNSRRLEAELVRDNVLWASGKLDLTMGGPEIDHQQGLTVRRRSLYFRHAAEKQMEFMKIFDAAGVNECYERRDSVVPQQALALANSELSLVHSRLLARELAAQSTNNPKSFVPAAFERVLARPATNTEIATCDEFLEAQARLFQENRGKTACADDPADGSKPSADCSLRAKENLVHALLNHNDFVTAR